MRIGLYKGALLAVVALAANSVKAVELAQIDSADIDESELNQASTEAEPHAHAEIEGKADA